MTPLVSIVCITYNQVGYIQRCLEGFLMQKTNFEYEILVNDDASDDGTPQIIEEYERQYPNLFRVIYQKENQYSKGISPWFDILFPIAKGKYIAICEGDDYWTDPYKLQEQVDFLETNPEYGMCYMKSQQYLQSSQQYGHTFGGPYTYYKDIIRINTIPTLTVVMKTQLALQFIIDIEPQKKNWKMGDYPMWIWFSYNSKIKFFNKTTGVYRILPNSASHSRSADYRINFVLSGIDIQEYFSIKYGGYIINRQKKEWQIKLYNYALSGELSKFINIWYIGIRKEPNRLLDVKPYKYLLLFIYPFIRNKYLQA